MIDNLFEILSGKHELEIDELAKKSSDIDKLARKLQETKRREHKVYKKISSMLDKVANSLESKGLIREAYELDKIADQFDMKTDNSKLIKEIKDPKFDMKDPKFLDRIISSIGMLGLDKALDGVPDGILDSLIKDKRFRKVVMDGYLENGLLEMPFEFIKIFEEDPEFIREVIYKVYDVGLEEATKGLSRSFVKNLERHPELPEALERWIDTYGLEKATKGLSREFIEELK